MQVVPKFFTVDSEHSDQRIDNFLFCNLKKVPRSLIYRMLRNGLIRVNKKRSSPSYKLQDGDVIRLPYITLSEQESEEPRKPSDKLIKLLESNILYEDDNLLVLNKPPGVASHGGSNISFGVIETMRASRPKLKNLELVHRLDKDTSGCLILAKKRSILRELHQQIFKGKVEKVYLVLVKGKWHGNVQKIDTLLMKNQLRSGERIVKVGDQGKQSVTIFRLQTIYKQFSLLEAKLETGRTHQIRVHAAHIGYPIAGDEKYGDKEFNLKLRQQGLKRLFLHAFKLKFYLPSQDKEIKIEAPLPQDLQDVLSSSQ